MNKELEALDRLSAFCDIGRYWNSDDYVVDVNTVKQALLKLDFLEDAIDLPTNCFSTFKNRNGDEVTIMRKERYEEYQEQEKVLNIIKNIIKFGDDLNAILNFNTYEEYNEWSWDYDLSKEEFELIGRMVGVKNE